MKEVIMIDITGKAQAYWESLTMKNQKEISMEISRLKEIVIIAFESGYMAHKHD